MPIVGGRTASFTCLGKSLLFRRAVIFFAGGNIYLSNVYSLSALK